MVHFIFVYINVAAKAKPTDVNQELATLGLAQIAAAFFQSMPVTGSICRSAVNAVSGVRTPFGGLWSGTHHFNAISHHSCSTCIIYAAVY
jgi:MFS superfamily sulfate permease-like transporter